MVKRSERYLAGTIDQLGFEMAQQDPRISSIARTLCLAQTGASLDGHDLAHRLGDAAEFYGLGPDDIQAILQQHEPSLTPLVSDGEI